MDLADARRKILSLIASLFDPFGFLAPFLVRAMLLLQHAWQFGIGWNETPPSEFLSKWSKFQKKLDSLSEFLVPRFYGHVSNSPTVIQLNVFGKASEQAVFSVAIFRFSYANGSVNCAFVTAKTRVAPKKPLSIPRLELQAAVLSARLSTVIIKEHNSWMDSTYLWADSSTAFQWLRGESKRHPAFIANRVGEFLSTTEPSQWNHCLGPVNPAYDGNRGIPVTAITSESRWLNGPVLLILSEKSGLKEIQSLNPPASGNKNTQRTVHRKLKLQEKTSFR